MGMAASQARYLALVARKSNCEYEGQQINQARLNLSNQSAKLFNQMLGLEVPTPPSTQDFTTTQYSYTDGINPGVIDKWEQLAVPDDNGYNYVVEHHYEAYVYKGFQKKMNDPQVQYTEGAVPVNDPHDEVIAIKALQDAIKTAQDNYDAAKTAYTTAKARASQLSTYVSRTYEWASNHSTITGATDNGDDSYTVITTGTDPIFYGYNNTTQLADVTQNNITKSAQDWIDGFVTQMAQNGVTINPNDIYVTNGSFGLIFTTKNSLEEIVNNNTTTLDVIPNTRTPSRIGWFTSPNTATNASVESESTNLRNLETALSDAERDLTKAQNNYNNYVKPEYVGNDKLYSLGELAEEERAEIEQIMATLKEQGADISNFSKCYDPVTNTYNGGIYKFEQNGVIYYTTYYDLYDSFTNGNGPNQIDNQPKLNYYHANYVKENINKVEKAILETDSRGRFSSVRFEDGATFTLNFEQKTDDAAYQDAMNQYYYKNAEYDKMIQDINAKTSIIQQEDVQLELRLKQLDTEQNALKNEIDAVQSVIKDNVEKSFKTFGG